MNIEGIVTSVCDKLLTFCLDDRVTVNASYLIFEDPKVRLPKLGQRVDIVNFHSKEFGVVYLCKQSEIKSSNSEDQSVNISYKNQILDLINTYNLGIPDLSVIHKCYDVIKRHFFCNSKNFGSSPEDLTLQVVSALINNATVSDAALTPSCSSKALIDGIELLPVSKLTYVDLKTDKYSDFPYWSFGVHPNRKNKFLVGYLFVNPLFGVPMIQDANYTMLCLIINPFSSLEQYFNSYLLINNYTVVTEMYRDKNVTNVEYIVINVADVKIIQHFNGRELLYHGRNTHSGSKYFISFLLESKSFGRLSMQNRLEYWLQVKIVDGNLNSDEKIVLCLDSQHLKIMPYLECDCVYKLCYNKPLENGFNGEVRKVYPHFKLYSLTDPSATFVKIDDTKSSRPPLMNARECKDYMVAHPDEIVSFQGKVKYKRFNDPISSRTERKISVMGFGTPGIKTHFVEFAVEDSCVTTLKLYINNWEASFMPCGFIPEMRILVRNVLSQKGKYLKSTAMTSFEILGYEPAISFRTMNLYTGSLCEDWGEMFYFGLGLKVPYGVLVTGRVETVFIRSFKLTSLCVHCNQRTGDINCKCIHSGEDKYKLELMIVLCVTDCFGSATIIARNEELLRVLLDLLPHEFNEWTKEFRRVGYYEYDRMNVDMSVPLFHKVLTHHINVINNVAIVPMQLACRKLDSKSDDDPNIPIWFCLRAKKL